MSINLIIASEFDLKLGPQIKTQYPINNDILLKDQLPFLSEIVIPDQLHNKSIDKEDYTLFPIYWNSESDTYKYSRTSKDDEQLVLFTVCNYKFDSSINRNYSIKSLSIITKLPCFMILKPIMIMLLEDYFQNPTNFDPIIDFYHQINNIPNFMIFDKASTISSISSIERLCYLEYLKQNEFNSELNKFEITFGENYSQDLLASSQYRQNKDSLETTIPIQFQQNLSLKIPIRLSIYSILGSKNQFYGYNLDHDTILKSFFNIVNSLQMKKKTSDNNSDDDEELFVFGSETPVICVLINAVLTKKKIVVLSYTKPIMTIIEFILSLLILMHNDDDNTTNDILQFNTFPYFDISKMDLVEGLDNFIIGTTNPIFKTMTKDDGSGDLFWDLFVDLDEYELKVVSRSSTNLQQQQNQTQTALSQQQQALPTPSSSSTSQRRQSSQSSTKNNNGDKRVKSFHLKIPQSLNLRKKFVNKRSSVNSIDSNSSMVIDEYFKDDYSIAENANDIDDNQTITPFKFEFEKALNIYSNNNTEIEKEVDHDFLLDKLSTLNDKVSTKQDDILIYIEFMKNIRVFGYDFILQNLQMSYNLNKLISFRTYRYENEFKNLKNSNLPQDINKALMSLEKSIIEINHKELIIPYNFNIFQFHDEFDKGILFFYNQEALKFRNFIGLSRAMARDSARATTVAAGNANEDQSQSQGPSPGPGSSPIVEEQDLKFSIEMIYYIHIFFEMFINFNDTKIDELYEFLCKINRILSLIISSSQNTVTIFYQLISIKRNLKFGNSIQDLNFIDLLILYSKFLKTNDDCNLEINKILHRFKAHWYCLAKRDEAINDFVD